MKARAEPTKAVASRGLRRDLKGLALAGFGVLGLLSLFSQSMGPVGHGVSWLLRWFAGSSAVLIPGLALVWGVLVVVWAGEELPRARLAGAVLLALTIAVVYHLQYPQGLEMQYGFSGAGGGVLGALESLVLVRLLGSVGRRFILGVQGLVGILLLTNWTLGGVIRLILQGLKLFARGAVNLWEDLSDLMGVDGSDEAPLPAESALDTTAWTPAGAETVASRAPVSTVPAGMSAGGSDAVGALTRWTFDGKPAAPTLVPEDGEEGVNPPAATGGMSAPLSAGQRFTLIKGGVDQTVGNAGSPSVRTETPGAPGGLGAPRDGAPGASSRGGSADDSAKKYQQMTMPPLLLYRLPSVIILKNGAGASKNGKRDQRDASDKATLLEETLASFDVQAKVVNISRGPTVTRFELEPGPGVKVAKITSLEDDLALKLAAQYVRIEAPVPGKAVIGIEVPNREISSVVLRDVVETPEFKSGTSKLTVALGKDIAGRPLVGDLRKMTHLLIAGATGSGKSVCINSIICSILFKARPDEVKFLMVDPKVVELTNYNDIPHLIAPVVTDPKKAASSLKWVVNEMTKRYESFAADGVKDMARYNAWARERPGSAEPLPFIVVVIDELADLMLVARGDVEDAIQRLAQMARAAGIHLIVATQRPSVDVITGVIKANIPSRIAFKVASQVDSRTILDISGAEKLLGRGDMLYWPVGEGKPTRAQGAYISDEELDDLVEFTHSQAEPTFASDVFAYEPTGGGESQSADDPLLPEAVKTILETGQASTSMLQRRLRVGYTRAARLMDMMEERGIVGRPDGSRPREILMTLDQYARLFGPGEQD